MLYDFVTIDFETANNNLNSACSIGIVAVKDLEIVSREYYLIKPPTEHFRNDNIMIHGITYNDVKDCDQFPSIWNKIKDYFMNVMIAHNANFDFSVLKNLFNTYQIDCNDFLYMDSITIAKHVCNCGSKLNDIADYLSIDINNHHNALDDAEACANIIIKCMKLYELPSFLYFACIYGSNIVKAFSNIKANMTFKPAPRKFQERTKISELVASTTEFDVSHPLFQKNVVLTGELNCFDRKEAMQKVTDVGGIVKSGVTRNTDYLVVGKQDKDIVGEDGMSSKEEKAYELIKAGYKIKIINEKEFIQLFQ